MKVFLIGAGLWSLVMAERIVNLCRVPVTIFECRAHPGGNCHSYIDAASGIELHAYGTHIFHTKKEHVWQYITKFTEFTPYRHTVLSSYKGKVYSMPINLGTINDYYGKTLNPSEAREFLRTEIQRDFIDAPKNLEEKAISLIGRPLYEAFVKGYTQKQWELDPKFLPAAIINRLPVRYSYNTDYFDDYWQGMPKDGYGALFEKMTEDPRITIEYETDFFEVQHSLPKDALIIYTGLPDKLFAYKHGELAWRSLRFAFESKEMQDFQGTSVMNYAENSVPFTRIHEFKHLHPERTQIFQSATTVICKEYSHTWHRGEQAYYPINNSQNMEIYAKYIAEAQKNPLLILGGRLGKYAYFDMDTCIDDALNTFEDVQKQFF